MEKLKYDSTIKSGTYAKKKVSNVIGIKGAILSMIKEGYDFEDDVLAAAHITKAIRDESVHCGLALSMVKASSKPLPRDTTPLKQILAELNIPTVTCENEETYKIENEQY